MDLRIRGLRSLVDTGYLAVRPITLLIGQNSSGKSTFLRTLPLLKQSALTPTRGPLLLYGKYVDFGDFDEAVNRRSSEQSMTFGWRFVLPVQRHSATRFVYGLYGHLAAQILGGDELKLVVALTVEEDETTKGTRPRTLEINPADHTAAIQFDPDGKVSAVVVNGREIEGVKGQVNLNAYTRLLPALGSADPKKRDESHWEGWTFSGIETLDEALVAAARRFFYGSTSRQTILNTLRRVKIGTRAQMVAWLRSTRPDLTYWSRAIGRVDSESAAIARIIDLLVARALPGLIASADSYLSDFIEQVHYIGPVRAVVERYYRPQSLAIDEVDFEGRNVPVLLWGLDKQSQDDLSQWLQTDFGLELSISSAGGHLSVGIKDSKTEEVVNLADTGFGLSQVLPVLIQVWFVTHQQHIRMTAPVTLAIEQPELHLHPALQYDLAKLFVRAVSVARRSGIDLRFVLETHSETMVNAFGSSIRKGEIDETEISVILFERGGLGEADVSVAKFNDRGILTNWPYGFLQPAAHDN